MSRAVDVRRSAIDGHGAFAGEAIAAGDPIGAIRGRTMSVKEARQRARGQRRIMVIELGPKLAIDASGSEDPLRYTNHSCRPNASLRVSPEAVEVVALRDIAAGEEITVDYGDTHHEGRLRCRCGVGGACRGQL